MHDYIQLVENKMEFNFSVHDRNAIINYSKLKSMSDQDRLNKSEKTAKELLDYKKKIVSYDPEPLNQSIIFVSDVLNNEDEIQFNLLVPQMNEKIKLIFDNNFSDGGSYVTNLNSICRGVKNFIIFYLDIKDQYSTTNNKLFDFFNQELILQLYKQMNRNEFSAELKIIQYTLGLLYILSFYIFDLNPNFMNSFKKWMNYHISKK
jgi:hypothetical protein